MRAACHTCVHWDGMGSADKGECRLFAPRTTIGQLDPDVRYSNPETAGWPVTRRHDFCGEHAFGPVVAATLTAIVREQIFGDGTDASGQRVIDLCRAAMTRFEIERA